MDGSILQEGLASSFDPRRNIYFLYQGFSRVLFYLFVTLMIMVYLYFYYVLRKQYVLFSLNCNILNLRF